MASSTLVVHVILPQVALNEAQLSHWFPCYNTFLQESRVIRDSLDILVNNTRIDWTEFDIRDHYYHCHRFVSIFLKF